MTAPETDLRIVPLDDARETIPTLTRWFETEWASWYGVGGPGDAAQDLLACCEGDVLPFALVALDANGAPIGTVALKRESLGADRHPGPWLAALLVAPSHRGAGVARTLVAAIEDAARYLEYDALYASMAPDSTLLPRRGWRPVDLAESPVGPRTVFRLDL